MGRDVELESWMYARRSGFSYILYSPSIMHGTNSLPPSFSARQCLDNALFSKLAGQLTGSNVVDSDTNLLGNLLTDNKLGILALGLVSNSTAGSL